VWSVSGEVTGGDEPKNKLPKFNFIYLKPKIDLLELKTGFPGRETDNEHLELCRGQPHKV
jgi:hypothetical protein